MTKRVYCVKDIRVGLFGPLMYFVNDAEAIRSFFDIASKPDTTINLHPSDYAVYFVGTFDVESGEFVSAPLSLLASGDQINK